jgi:2-polyprenyl-3-methyl-5-hydroxy-6-metoxy-1,4-benzoquinol methylase
MLSNGLACNMLGIDASRDAIALANSHYANEQTFYVHKIFPFSLPETAFDFITCYESLEHVGKAPLLVKELGTSLKRDGCLFLSVPNEPCLPLSKNPNPFHCKHYSMQEIMSMVSELTDLELLMWLGQNLYEVCDGKVCGSLPEDKMELLESQEGQLLVCVFRKR